MYSTGSSSFNAFLHIAVYSPAIPLFIIIIRQLFVNQTFNLLMIYCLLSLFFTMFADLSQTNLILNQTVTNIQFLVEFIILSLLMRSAIVDHTIQQIINVITILFSGVVITYSLMKGMDTHLPLLYGFGNVLLVMNSVLLAIDVVRSEKKNLVSSYLFWIVAAIFFFYGCFFLLAFGWKFIFTRNNITAQEIWQFSFLALILKSTFFSVGAIVYRR